MAWGTTNVAVATTPTVVASFVTYVLHRHKKLKANRPDAEFTYNEGLVIVRRFLEFAANHPIEDLQAFTAMHLPVPRWVHRQVVRIADDSIHEAEDVFAKHIEGYGDRGFLDIGGAYWWRQRGRTLEGEWIEMKTDWVARAASKVEVAAGQADASTPKANERVILYVHGGAGFFSSLDTHRYQIQRHARKLGGRAFAPAYRLAPQYPFPCGLIDCLAAYLFLIRPPPGATHEPVATSNLILSGDSHGANMIISLLCILRDEGLPLPAGATLISPWVDLAHSFPSIVGPSDGDYIPPVGFHFQPSLAWPPLPGDGIDVDIDGKTVRLDDQIQMYCSNRLLNHPLVSPVNQGSLGGLCPLLILGGSGELLRDEIVYLAHKAAAPARYPPSPATLETYAGQRELIERYPPTKVQLQLYDGTAHVLTTLSFTVPAKYMFRSCANFNIWAITAAGKAQERGHHHHTKHAHRTHHGRDRSQPPSRSSTVSHLATDTSGQAITDEAAHEAANEADLHEDDLESEASSSSGESDHEGAPTLSGEVVSVTGTVPSFGTASIVRHRVSTKGRIRPMEPEGELPALNLGPDHVGAVRSDGPIRTWLKTRADYDKRFAKSLAKFRALKHADRLNAQAARFPLAGGQGHDVPPLTSLAAWYDPKQAAEAGKAVDGVPAKQTSGLVAMWSKAGGEADRVRQEKHEAATTALQDKMEELGVEKEAQGAAADAPVEAVREHLEAEGSPLTGGKK